MILLQIYCVEWDILADRHTDKLTDRQTDVLITILRTAPAADVNK